MKHFFPFLTITLILCMLVHTSSILSVSAQQHNSFASAKSLSLDHSVSISLPANATEYYYFSSLQLTTDHTDQKYQITLSEADSLSISAYDDQGSSVNLIQAGTGTSHWTGYIDNVSNNARFFLVLHNHSKQDVSTNLTLKSFTATVTPNSNNSTKNTATAKPDKKMKPTINSKKTATPKPKISPKHTPVLKSKHTQSPRGTARQNSDRKFAATQKPRSTSEQHFDTKTTTPKPQNTARHSRSNSILSTHFFRMSTGYPISAFELLPLNLSDREITLETMTPEKLSLQNNIIYAKAPGLAVIKIYSDNGITSCTIYIQEPQ